MRDRAGELVRVSHVRGSSLADHPGDCSRTPASKDRNTKRHRFDQCQTKRFLKTGMHKQRQRGEEGGYLVCVQGTDPVDSMIQALRARPPMRLASWAEG